MTKTEPQWIAPFLAALKETANVRWSAQQAGVDFTAVYDRRNRHAAFAEAWAQALQSRELANRQPAAAPDLPGRHGNPVPSQELIERVCARNGPQLVRAGAGRWSKGAEERFLTTLAACANVKRAAADAGFSDTAIYRRRLNDRRFAEAWDSAVAIGRARIEAYLVEAADRTFDPASILDDADVPKMTIAEAIKVLQVGQAKSGRAAKADSATSGRGWIGEESWDDPDDEEAVAQARDNIIARIQRLRDNEVEEKTAAGWTRYGDDWVPPGWERREADRPPDGPTPPLVVEAKALPDVEDDVEARGPSVRAL